MLRVLISSNLIWDPLQQPSKTIERLLEFSGSWVKPFKYKSWHYFNYGSPLAPSCKIILLQSGSVKKIPSPCDIQWQATINVITPSSH